jgi:acyl-CoA synthetase (AMP-forming)/AMP-acid ligase II
MGSAPVSEALMAALKHALPKAAITNAYGTTEGGPVVFGPHPKGIPTPALSVGYPHLDVQVRLAGGASQGELEMKSPAIMNGYHNRPDLPSPITPDGFYITGDVFRRDENGFHFFLGRTDDMFVSGGENIYPGDVERMLERHPGIVQVCVVPIDDEIKGQKPVAFVVPKQGHRLPRMGSHYALKHARYQHPRHVWFVDKLPLSSTSKRSRRAETSAALASRRRHHDETRADHEAPTGEAIAVLGLGTGPWASRRKRKDESRRSGSVRSWHDGD